MNIENHLLVIVSATFISAFTLNAEDSTLVKLKQFPQNTEFANRSTADIRSELEEHEALAGTGTENPRWMRMLRVELARRGDREARQKIFQAIKSPVSTVQFNALGDAAQLADREAVYYLAEMLSDPTPGGRATYVARDGTIQRSNDFAIPAPRQTAARKLAELLENPPISPSGGYDRYTDEDMAIWQKWWKEHKTEFNEFTSVSKEESSTLEIQATPNPEQEELPPIITNTPKFNPQHAIMDETEQSCNETPPKQPEKSSSSKTVFGIVVIALLAIVGGVVVWRNKLQRSE